jgi:hypothetical protein
MSACMSTRLHPDIERVALLGWRCVPATRTKKGMFEGYLQAATHDLDQLERWAHAYPGCNWKVVPEGSGIWALDVDVPCEDHANDGVAALRALCEQHGPIPPRPHGRSGSGGHIMVFRDDGRPMLRGSERPQRGMDTCAGRVAFTIAPSRGRGGVPYRWQVAPWDLAPPVAPEWLLGLLKPPPAKAHPERPVILTEDRARRSLARVVDKLLGVEAGGRNAALNRAAYTVGGLIGAGKLTEQEAVFALYTAGRHIGLEDAECRATIRSGLDAGAQNPLGGNA